MDDKLTIKEQPKEIVKFGQTAAQQLIGLVKQNNWAVRIQNNDYLRFEAWQTVGRFFGYTVKTLETKYVELGRATGFEAKAVVLNQEGREVGAAEALCLDDENNWKGKPLYSLKSMAQTRACAKAFRQVLAWVVVLAGYKPTPVEEMGEEITNGMSGDLASEKQAKAIFAIAKAKIGWDPEETKINVKERFNLKSYNDLTKSQASEVINELQDGKMGTAPEPDQN